MGVGNIATTGLQAALSNMETISNNIANVNSIGFKKSFVTFSDISSSGGGANAIGLGTRVQSVQQDFSQGRIEQSSRGLDLRLNGNGFFVQKNLGTGQTSYSRAGRMDFDANGYLVGLGGRIQGYPAVNGKVASASNVVDLQRPTAPIPAQATSTVNLGINLDSGQAPIASAFNPNDSTTYNYRSDETVYDSLGNSYLLSAYYVKTANNTWTTQVTVNNTVIGTGTLNFTSSGALSSTSGLSNIAWNPPNGAAAGQLTLNLAGSTQYSSSSPGKVVVHNQNGNPSGSVTGCIIDENGNLNVSYSNGMSQIAGQIAVAQFNAPQGLVQTDNMSWLPTTDSGPAELNPQFSTGAITTSSVEYSNVDLTEELVKLISAQHDFQANAQVEQTYNQVLQTIENI